MQEIKEIRKQFPALKNNIYLDNAATTQKPLSVIEELSHFYQHEYATVHRAVYAASMRATERCEAVRDALAQYINAKKSAEIIFTRGTTESINIVAQGAAKAFLQPGDEIVLTEVEHHANLVPWQQAAKASQATLKFIPVNDQGEIDLQACEKIISSKTKIVALAHVSNVLGTIHPIKRICDLAHAKGAYVLVDGAQAIAHMPIDVQDLGADFYAFSSHKMYGPTGVGILYGRYDLLEMLPPLLFGGDMIDQVTLTKTTFAKTPQKFEAGTPMIAEIIGLGAALQFLKKKPYSDNNVKLLYKELSQIDRVHILGPKSKRGPLVSFHVEGAHPLDIGSLLDAKNISVRTGHLCSQPTMERFSLSVVTRASLAVYNTEDEISLFLDSLKSILKVF